MEGLNILNEDGIVTLTFTQPGRVNKIGEAFTKLLVHGIETALATEGLKGIILTSGHRDFCVGADIDMIFDMTEAQAVFDMTTGLNQLFRKLETSGVPVVAALNGAALGGGYELALACHHRVAINNPKALYGLPEVNLGVIPGAGGTQRLPYLMGLQASMEAIATARTFRAPKAKASGLVDALVESKEELIPAAKAWIAENPKPVQPWDQKRWSWPGGARPNTPAAMQLFVGAAAFLYKKTLGAYPAAEAVVKAVSEGTKMKFDRALEMESRLFAKLAVSQQSKSMIRTLWYHKNAAEKLGTKMDHGISKVTVLGAGMMGAGLAFVSAKAGFEVVLKDISDTQLEAGKKHCETQAGKLRHLSADEKAAILSRITFTLDYEAVKGSDLVIEAIVENVGIKQAVIKEVEPLLAENGIFASNTSAIPITLLSEASVAKDRFIGLHFFSPVEKMALLEVIQPEACSQDTLNRCLAFGKAIKKTNIVVNDGYGFFTSRLFAAYLLEGVELVAEGHDPAVVEYAARTAGMVMPPLKVFDEVTLTLGQHVFESRKEVTGVEVKAKGLELIAQLVDAGRTGKAHGAGFYDWETRTIWPGLRDLVDAKPEVTGLEHLQRRLMIAQVAEVGRIIDDGIMRDYRDVEVGAILGLGFAPNTGGPLTWADNQGLPALVEEMKTMAATYGERYAPAQVFIEMAESGKTVWQDWSR